MYADVCIYIYVCISIAVLPGIQICSKFFSATGGDRQPAALPPAILLGHGMREVTVLTSAVLTTVSRETSMDCCCKNHKGNLGTI